MTDAPRMPDREAAPDRQAAPDREAAPEIDAAPPEGGERRLARPPSDRFASAVSAPVVPDPSGHAAERTSPARGIGFGAIAAVVGAALIVVLGGALAISAGLLVAAAAIGYAVGLAVVAGSGGTLSSPGRPALAAVLAGIGLLLGQVGLWLYARSEGGVLPLIDYLGQTFGFLVPLEVVLAIGVAWWRAR